MAFKKKTWADRMVEYAGRRKLTNISTEQSIICDVERSEGTISKEGDAFSSQNMNDLEQRIEDGFTEVKQTTDGINQNLGNINGLLPSGITNLADLLKYWISNGYLSDPNLRALVPFLTGNDSRIIQDRKSVV